MAVEVKFQADVSAAVQSIKQLEKANAEAAKSGNADASALDRGRMAQDALKQAHAVRQAAAAAKEETEARIKLQAAALAAAKADAKGADASTEAGKAKLQNLKDQQDAMDRLLDRARKLKKQVTGGDELIGRAQNASRSAMADVSAASQKIRNKVEYKATVKNETGSGFSAILRSARSAGQKINATFKKVSDKIGRLFRGVSGGVAAVAGFAGISLGLSAIRQEIDRMDNLSKLSRSLGMTGEQMQVLQYAAQSANVPIEQLNNAIPKVSKVISDAGRGSAEAVGKLDRLGLSLEDLRGKSTYEQMQLVAGAISGIQDPTERSARAMEMFGESGARMVDMLSGLAGAEANLRAQGGIISEEQLQAAEAFNQALTNIHRNIVSALMNSGFVKWLADVAEGFNAMATNASRMEQLGVYDRERAVDTVINEALAAGKIDQKKADQLRSVKNYKGGDLKLTPGADPMVHTMQIRQKQIMDERKKELDAMLAAGGFSYIAKGADNQTREKSPEERRAEAEKANAEKKKREAAAAATKAAKEEAERKKKEEAAQKEIAALDKQLQDLGKINRGPQTREEFIRQELEKAQKAAPSQFESRRVAIEQAAGEAFDRREAGEAARSKVDALQRELDAVRNSRAEEYQGDSLRRIGGIIGGSGYAERYQQTLVRHSADQLKKLNDIYSRIDQIKRDNPHVFK